MSNVFDGDVIVRGELRPAGVSLPNNSVGNAQVNAADPILATKLGHQYAAIFAQARGSAAATERRAVHVARGAGTLADVRASLTQACAGAATITVQVLKNGTNVLTSTLTLDNTTTAFTNVLGVFSATSYAAGDVWEVSVTATAGGGTLGQGVVVGVFLREAAD